MSKPSDRQDFAFPGPVGSLEGLLESPGSGKSHGSVVVCHPHPLHGGTMQNKVAHTLARAFVASGYDALRFNFRGVGRSEGRFDDGRGEVRDVLAAVRFLRAESPDLPLWLAGFSFGAAMAVRAAMECHPAGLISVAPAISRFAGNLAGQPACPWLIIQGDRDELVGIDDTIDWVNELEPGPELLVLAGTDHFFHGRLVPLRDAVTEFLARHCAAP